jgi:hypothetical protein
MTMLARDVSNYSVPLTPELLEQWKAEGVGHLLIQAFPPDYQQYAEQRNQMRAAVAAGLTFDCYVYDYLSDPTWLWGALDGIAQALQQPHMIWLDEEDVQTDQGMDPEYRVYLIRARVQNVKDRGWSVGIYTGQWWWVPKTGNSSEFSGLKLWTAQYDNIANASVFSPYGGWMECRVKQYAGSQPDGTDLNVLSAAEEAELTGTDIGGDDGDDMADCQQYKQALERVVNRIQIEDERKTSTGKTAAIRRTILREIASEAFKAIQT